MTTTVTSKGQVTIPKRVRELLGIGPGSLIDFERGEDGRIVLVNIALRAACERASFPTSSSAPTQRSTDGRC
jgi:antitoxin PrlF